MDKQIGASTHNQAFNALLFLFRNVFKKEFTPEGVRRARRTRYIPQTLTHQQIDDITSLMGAPHGLIARLLYGCGLRLTEALTLRVHNFDFDLQTLTVHQGKGQKDRTVSPSPGCSKNR